VLVNDRLFVDQHHPVCAAKRRLRDIVLRSRPPLLG
jgi:hypothetical protein